MRGCVSLLRSLPQAGLCRLGHRNSRAVKVYQLTHAVILYFNLFFKYVPNFNLFLISLIFFIFNFYYSLISQNLPLKIQIIKREAGPHFFVTRTQSLPHFRLDACRYPQARHPQGVCCICEFRRLRSHDAWPTGSALEEWGVALDGLCCADSGG